MKLSRKDLEEKIEALEAAVVRLERVAGRRCAALSARGARHGDRAAGTLAPVRDEATMQATVSRYVDELGGRDLPVDRRVFVHIGSKTARSSTSSPVGRAHAAAARGQLLLQYKATTSFGSMIVATTSTRQGPGAFEAATTCAPTWPSRRQLAGQPPVLVRRRSSSTRWPGRDSPPPRSTSSSPRADQLGSSPPAGRSSLKNQLPRPFADYGRSESDDPRVVSDWRALDLGRVLDRWAPPYRPSGCTSSSRRARVDPGRAVAPGRPRARRRAATRSTSRGFADASMGVVGRALLRVASGSRTSTPRATRRGGSDLPRRRRLVSRGALSRRTTTRSPTPASG